MPLIENIYPNLGYKETYTMFKSKHRKKYQSIREDMVVVQKILVTVSKSFPAHRPLIRLAFYSSAVFRETCMDYHECSKALHYWSNVSSQEASSRKQEYSTLLQELEQEILQSLAPHDSYIQNKGVYETKQRSLRKMKRFLYALLFMAIFATVPALHAVASSDDDLLKAAQNPMANMMSFPFQNNTNFGYGPLEKTQNMTNIQPVIPFDLGENWLLISRTVAPLISQPEFYDGHGTEFGLGNITQSLFIGPSKPGKIIWGAGSVFLLPTATDSRLGGKKWGAGPAAVVLTMQGPWVVGGLVQNIWSFAGPGDEDDVNQMLAQYFINYNLPNGWYITSSPIITANWEADSDNRWTVPLGGGFGRLFKIGKLPVNAQCQAFYNVEKPDVLGPDWTLRFQLQFLLPKG